jgi:uncharacterized protein YceH (UPF0502 family)
VGELLKDDLEKRLEKLEREMAELKRILEDNDLWNFEEEEEVTKHG